MLPKVKADISRTPSFHLRIAFESQWEFWEHEMKLKKDQGNLSCGEWLKKIVTVYLRKKMSQRRVVLKLYKPVNGNKEGSLV